MSHISSSNTSPSDNYLDYDFGNDFLNVSDDPASNAIANAHDTLLEAPVKGSFGIHEVKTVSPNLVSQELQQKLHSIENRSSPLLESDPLYDADIISIDGHDSLEALDPALISEAVFDLRSSPEPEQPLSKISSTASFPSTKSSVVGSLPSSSSSTDVTLGSSRKRKSDELTQEEKAFFDTSIATIEQEAKKTYAALSSFPQKAKKETEKITTKLFNNPEFKQKLQEWGIDSKTLIKAVIEQALPNTPEIQEIENNARIAFAQAINKGASQEQALVTAGKSAIPTTIKGLFQKQSEIKNKIYFALRACNTGTADQPTRISHAKANKMATEIMNLAVA